jgi:monothiol glutaredoxin
LASRQGRIPPHRKSENLAQSPLKSHAMKLIYRPSKEKVEHMSAQEQIKKTVTENDVVLYMKGTPVFPQCGFSSPVVQILDYVGVEYASVNVLEDPKIRQGIKDYNNWPTIPQVFVKGEFIGGCDIVKEMFETGELRTMLSDKGIKTTA